MIILPDLSFDQWLQEQNEKDLRAIRQGQSWPKSAPREQEQKR